MKKDGLYELAFDIIKRATEDYMILKKSNVDYKRDPKYGEFSIKELEKFFKGDWCNLLLKTVGIDLSGEEIMAAASRRVELKG